MTIERIAGFEDKLVPAARMLPSNAEYLKHLALSGGEGVIRLASNENTDRPSPAVARALARAFEDANLSPPPTSPLARELAVRHGVAVEQVLVSAGSTAVGVSATYEPDDGVAISARAVRQESQPRSVAARLCRVERVKVSVGEGGGVRELPRRRS